jgi:hypothetical protein
MALNTIVSIALTSSGGLGLSDGRIFAPMLIHGSYTPRPSSNLPTSAAKCYGQFYAQLYAPSRLYLGVSAFLDGILPSGLHLRPAVTSVVGDFHLLHGMDVVKLAWFSREMCEQHLLGH